MPDLGAFHFLRPAWLAALAPIAWVAFALSRRASAAARWRGVVEPHLLVHLVVRPHRGFVLQPRHLLVATLALAAIALAGPSWRPEPSPFAEDVAPLVLALDLSSSMQVDDIRPSRFERAQQKVRDLLARRGKAPTALLVYAGSAHRVLPLTDDPGVIESFVTALDPSVMPLPGKNPAAAVRLAREMLADETTPGTIVFLTDGIATAAAPAFATRDGRSDQVVVLAIATDAGGRLPGSAERSALDRTGLETLEREAGAVIVGGTHDDADVERVERSITAHLAAARLDEGQEGRWRDDGWWLTWPILLCALATSRKGWMVRWES